MRNARQKLWWEREREAEERLVRRGLVAARATADLLRHATLEEVVNDRARCWSCHRFIRLSRLATLLTVDVVKERSECLVGVLRAAGTEAR